GDVADADGDGLTGAGFARSDEGGGDVFGGAWTADVADDELGGGADEEAPAAGLAGITEGLLEIADGEVVEAEAVGVGLDLELPELAPLNRDLGDAGDGEEGRADEPL